MSLRNTLVLLVALCALSFLVACGGSSSPAPTPPPSGGLSTSNLNGTYVFSTSGQDSAGDFITMVGSLAANGSGSVTGGVVDIFSADFIAAAQPITGGNYKITADGRGQLNFNTTVATPNGNSAATFTLDFVLLSNSHGLVTEYDINGTGSGTIDLQSTVSQSQLAGSFAFGVSGTGATAGGSTFATVGAFTLSSTGAVTVGQEDVNNAVTPSTGTIATTSTVSLGATPGTATIASSLGSSYQFDVYPIDSTHFKLIQVDGQLFTSGDAYTQATAVPTGQLVFTMSGENLSAGSPIDVGGYLTNSGGTVTAGLEDFNDGGNVSQATAVTGSFGALSGGRSTLALNGFVNGAASDVVGAYSFAAYPFTAGGVTGVELLEIDSLGITSGTVYAQTATTLAASQGFGLNLTGINGSGEEDDIAEFTTSTTGFTGLVDLNDYVGGATQQTFDKALTGTFPSAVDANGRGTASTNFFTFDFYTLSSSTYLLLETDTTQVGEGIFEQQGGTSGIPADQPAASLMHQAFRAHIAKQKKK
jgi:hypothetical protein